MATRFSMGDSLIESRPKKTRQGKGKHSKYSATSRNGARRDTGSRQMNCWHCGTELIWGADFDMEDVNDGEESEYDFFSSFTCPNVNLTLKFIIIVKWLV